MNGSPAQKKDLPAGVECEMGPVATAMGEIYQYTLEGKEPADPNKKVAYFTELRTLAGLGGCADSQRIARSERDQFFWRLFKAISGHVKS